MSEQGAAVIVADIDVDEAAESAQALPGRAIAVEHDVRDGESSLRLVTHASEAFGHVDILVNNAGVNSPAMPTVDITDEEFDRVMNVNARGLFLTTRAFLPGMLDRGHGRIINMSSVVGHKGVPFVLPYSASKFAVVGMTHSLAGELASNGITVNSVHPGLVDTTMHEAVVRGWSKVRGSSVEETWEWFRSLVPQGELQSSRDVGEVVAFLASDRAQHITGAAFDVDGGMLMH
jgi:NAD(P)-dependent dehydrogenase (short-subunit alcohol dehydrogenase family)